MRPTLLIVMVLVLPTLLLASCGIPQEEYNAVVAERDAAYADLAKAQSDLAKAQSNLAKAQSELETAQSDLAAANSQVSSLQSEIGHAEEQIVAASSAWSSLKPKMELTLSLMESDVTWWRYELKEINDSELSRKVGHQWGVITVCLDEIGDDEFAEVITDAWYAEGDEKGFQLACEAYTMLISLTEEAMASLSSIFAS